jgi:hypothetical protein
VHRRQCLAARRRSSGLKRDFVSVCRLGSFVIGTALRSIVSGDEIVLSDPTTDWTAIHNLIKCGNSMLEYLTMSRLTYCPGLPIAPAGRALVRLREKVGLSCQGR